MYVKLNHFTVYQKLTQYCKLTILQLKKRVRLFISDYGPHLQRVQQNHVYSSQRLSYI